MMNVNCESESMKIQIMKFHRKYENDDERFFEIIKPAIRKYKGNIYGAGIKLY